MDLYDKIKKNHADWSQRIKDTMSGRGTPYKPSFEEIITDRIKACCPALRGSSDNELSQNNIYIVQSVFDILFKTVYNSLELEALEVISSDSKFQLKYSRRKTIAQGDESYMYKLKDHIVELARAQNLRNIIEN